MEEEGTTNALIRGVLVKMRMNVEGANKKLKAEKGITADEVTDASDME